MTPQENDRLTRVGPGTPMGTLLRRYWHPVALTDDVTRGAQPKAMKVLGEELVLFRDDFGRPALLGRRCSHRLTSLSYGRVEDGGIRCPFHGWLYDLNGRCLQQPAEPENSGYRHEIRHTAYPCRDLGGLVFAYLGPPERMPLLANYETLVRDGGTRAYDVYTAGGNFLQHLEGALDTVHLSYLHATNWSKIKEKLFTMPKPKLEHRETDYGIWQKANVPNMSMHEGYGNVHGIMQDLYAYFVMPAGFLRVQEHMPGSGLIQSYQSWYVPIDDANTIRFQVGYSSPLPDGTLFEWPAERTEAPSAANDYFRDYANADTISGIPVDRHRTPIQVKISFIPQDMMANEEQGDIVDRTLEHLTPHDTVLVHMRRIYLEAIDDVAAGRDPKHVIRDPQSNRLIAIRNEETAELT